MQKPKKFKYNIGNWVYIINPKGYYGKIIAIHQNDDILYEIEAYKEDSSPDILPKNLVLKYEDFCPF